MKDQDTLTLRVQDVTGQREVEVSDIPRDASWAEVMQSLLNAMELPANSPNEDGALWSGRLDRDGGRNLLAGEVVGDVLVDGDRVTLQPEINAGATGR